ncbi:MAG: hypothetical protein E7240_03915 [Lachnospiraceae bacterium]|nr:hypothetical protein [Lachnospiraceae bacterium]
MKTKLFNNIGLKIVSLILGFFVWLSVVNVNDPIITRTISNIPVTVTNASYVESLGMSCKLKDGSDTVSVMITGHRSVVEPLVRDDIKAVADLTQIVSMESDPIMVPVTVSTSKINRENISASPGSIEIALEEMQNAEFVIAATTGDTKPSNKRYQVGELTVSPESVTITGPSSLIQIIDRVTAPVDATQLVSDTVVSSELVIYDRNGAQFTDSQMESLKFSKTEGTVSVGVDIWRVVSDITLEPSIGGSPEMGYRVGEVTVTPAVVSVAGTDEALNALSNQENKIEIPADLLNVDGAKDDLTVRVDLTQILPEDIKLADNVSTVALVSVEILPLDSRTFEIPVAEIEQRNVPENLSVIYRIDKVRVRVQGEEEKLAGLTENDIKLSIDFTGFGEGTFEDYAVMAALPEGFSTVVAPTVNFEIAKTVESEEENTSGEESAP